MPDKKVQLDYINARAMADPAGFVAEAEKNYDALISSVVEKACEEHGHTIIMLAGPSASGKTTSSRKIAARLNERGIDAFYISLDDFYNTPDKMPLDAEGKPDFESVDSLDLVRLVEVMNRLIKDGESELPVFDFMSAGRAAKSRYLKLEADDVVILEGLHALNPKITDSLPHESLFRTFFNLSSRVFDGDEPLLKRRDLRFIRRMVRDSMFRSSTPEHTANLWKGVTRGEKEYLFPFESRAELLVDSIHPYEPCVLKKPALPLLRELEKNEEFGGYASYLISALNRFVEVDDNLVPLNSLLREFIGPDFNKVKIDY